MFYVVQERGATLDASTGKEYPIEKGNFLYVEPGTIHAVESFTGEIKNAEFYPSIFSIP